MFDTWAGDLPDGLCEQYCFDPIRRICDQVKEKHPGTPVIGFARGIGARQKEFALESKVDAIGLEWAYPVARAREDLQPAVDLS